MKWEFKDGNWIHSTAIVKAKIGTGNIIYPYAVIGETGFIREIHPVHSLQNMPVIGDNNRIGIHAAIMAGATIGNSNLIMNFVNIGHDCVIGDNNEIGAGTVVCGYVTIGNSNKIKVSCALRNRITIGSNNIIGMRANVVASIESNETVMGNPAKKKKTDEHK